ncbi:3889_t:CDS:2, partial [Gigaspora rosea]
ESSTANNGAVNEELHEFLDERPPAYNTDSSDENVDVSSLKLTSDQSFHTWDDVEKFLNEYGLEKGFSVRRRRTDSRTENGTKILCKVSWECSCAGKYKAKKVLDPNNQRNRQFKATDYEHNHPMVASPETNIARYRKFSNEMIEFVEFCVNHGVTSARIGQVEFDASDLMRHLYLQRAEDSHWFVEAKFEKDKRRLCGLVWMSPEQQMLWTHYHDVLFFDTTSRTNKYNMMACFFVIIDNCNKTRLVATAMLEDETENSF